MRFKIEWPSWLVGSKLNVLLCLTLYLRAIFQVQAPVGLIFGWRFNEGFFALPDWGGLYLEGPIHGGAYFRNFTVVLVLSLYCAFD